MDPQQDIDGDRNPKLLISDGNFILSKPSSVEVNLLLTLNDASDMPQIRRLLFNYGRVEHVFTDLAQNTKLYYGSFHN